MKKTFTFLAMAAFGLSAIAQVFVPETNKGVYNKVTATWCGPCGAWGWDLSDQIKNGIGDNILFTLQASNTGALHSPNATTMAQAITFTGYPNFFANYVNETVQDQNGIYTTQTKNAVIASIQAHETATVDVQVGFEATKDQNDITVNTTTKFFNDMDGDYYLAVYAIENGIMQSQYVTSQGYQTKEHNHVMRKSASSSAWGEQIASGNITAGSTYDKTFTIPIDGGWDADNIEVALVITDKIGNIYNFVNANGKPNEPVGIKGGGDFVNEVKVYPNPANEATVVRVKSVETTKMSVDIYNAIGQNVANVFNGSVMAQKDILVNTANLESGIYFVKVTSGEKVKTVKLNVAH